MSAIIIVNIIIIIIIYGQHITFTVYTLRKKPVIEHLNQTSA